MCRPEWQVSALSSAYFIGCGVTLLWLPRFADIYGRKKMYTLGMVLQVIFYTAIMFTRNYYVMLISIFIFGTLISFRNSIGFIYFLELVPKKNRAAAGTAYCVIDGLVYPFLVIYFWKISKDWFWLLLIGYAFQIMGCICSFL